MTGAPRAGELRAADAGDSRDAWRPCRRLVNGSFSIVTFIAAMPAMLGYSAPSQLFRQTYHAAGPARQHPGARTRASRARGGMTRAPFFRRWRWPPRWPPWAPAPPTPCPTGSANASAAPTRSIPTRCAQPFHGLAAVMTGSEEDEVGRWAISTSKAAWRSRPRSRRPRRSRTAGRGAPGRPVGLYRRQGRLGHPPGLCGSNRLQRPGHGAGPYRRTRRAHRPPGPDRQDAAAGRAQLGFQPGQTLAEIEVPQPPRLFNVATAAR